MLRGPEERLRLIVSLLVAVLLPTMAQLFRLQVLEHARFANEAEKLVHREYSLPAPPPGCVRDRNDDLLVGNKPVYKVGIEVNLITDTMQTARRLAGVLDRPVGDLRTQLMLTRQDKQRRLVWRRLERGVSLETKEALDALDIRGLTMTPHWERHYPEGGLAAHVLGFVNQSGVGAGVQAYHRRFLEGVPLVKEGRVSGMTAPFPDELANDPTLPYGGTDLTLTLDRTIQAYVEGELDKAMVEYKAEAGTIIVMDPRTGAILAMVSRPFYEPSRFADYAAQGEEAIFQNPAISHAYEPGSTFKIVTVAAALDSGRADSDWTYHDKGILEYGGIAVNNWSGVAYGQQGVEGILVHSLNVGVAQLTTQVLGDERFYDYVRAFGFGQPTGVDLTGEASGVVHLPSDWDWRDSYLVTNAYGQGIAVTPLQLVTAVGAVANDGIMMQPYIVAERHYADGRVVPIPPREVGRPISAETAHTLSTLLEQAVEQEIPQAQVSGYRIAGKTGTAQVPVPGAGVYDPEHVITSFIGFGPLPDPQLLILVKLDRPAVEPNERWGSHTAAPVFREVASRLFVLLGIPPSYPLAQQP
jgi:cell division protein FtsI (penicillin-binding protein 3)